MKKIITYFVGLLIGLSIFTSCDDLNEPIILDNGNRFIAFEKTSSSVKENGGAKVGILVYIVSTQKTGGTVAFDFDTVGIANPAIEGVDFTLVNDAKTLNFSQGFGYDTIWISPMDNEVYDKDKIVNIVLSSPSAGFDLGANYICKFTVVDNEHPLSLVIGDYTINYVTNMNGGSDGSLDIETLPNPDDETQIYFLLDTWVGHAGYPGTYTDADRIYCNIDLVAGTIKIASGQAYPDGKYGPIKLQGFDADGDMEDGEFIEGTIDADGNISIPDGMSLPFTSGTNVGYVFDSWKSSEWAKKSSK